MGDWSSGMIPALGAGGHEFDSRITPFVFFCFFPPQSHKKKKDPGNRSRTSDLEISVVAIYSLPLCQLSYTRMSVGLWVASLFLSLQAQHEKQKQKRVCSLWGSNPRSYEHAP
jgi:hypothetical protein